MQGNCMHDSLNTCMKMGGKLYAMSYGSGSHSAWQPPSHFSHWTPSRWWDPQADPAPSLATSELHCKAFRTQENKGGSILCLRDLFMQLFPLQQTWVETHTVRLTKRENQLLPCLSLWIFMQSQAVPSPAQGVSRSSVSHFWVSDLQPYPYWHILRCSRHAYCDFIVSLPTTQFLVLHLFLVVLKMCCRRHMYIFMKELSGYVQVPTNTTINWQLDQGPHNTSDLLLRK